MPKYHKGQMVYIKHTNNRQDKINENIPIEILTHKIELIKQYKIEDVYSDNTYRLDIPHYKGWFWMEKQLLLYDMNKCEACKYFNICDKIHCRKENI